GCPVRFSTRPTRVPLATCSPVSMWRCIAPSKCAYSALFDIQIESVYSIGVPDKERAKADVLQGTLDIMILQTLSTLGPSHGYAIAARLEQVSDGRVRRNMGTLYPVLMRLEQRSCISGEWGVTDNNRRGRFLASSA